MRAALAPSLVLFVVTLAGGGLVTFLPIERPDGVLATVALLLFGVTGASPAGARACSPTGWAAGCCCRSRWSSAAVGMVLTARRARRRATAWVLVGAARLRRRLRRDAEPDPARGVRAGRRGRDDDGERDVEHRRSTPAPPSARWRWASSPPGSGWTGPTWSSAALLAAAVPLASAAARVAVRS